MKNFLYKVKFFLAPTLFIPIAIISLYYNDISILKDYNWLAYIGPIFVFLVIPILDIIFPPSTVNPTTKSEEEEIMNQKSFDILVLIILPIQIFILSLALYRVYDLGNNVSLSTLIGWTLTLGMSCGILGINVGHEMGHRVNSWHRFIGKGLLWSSLRMSFYIEHNWGHHSHVSTPEDPASAKKWEIVWFFIPKSIFLTWTNSWKIQLKLLKNRGVGFFSIYNDIFWYTIIQWSTIFMVFFFCGIKVGLVYLGACLIGMVLLEMVNYIEHYGLRREKKSNGRYERTLPIHSWNSDHSFSGAALFNLSRHSDHHFIASRPYQILRNFKNAPNMPTGYAGMIVLSWFPPLWYAVMHPKINTLKNLSKNEEIFTQFTQG